MTATAGTLPPAWRASAVRYGPALGLALVALVYRVLYPAYPVPPSNGLVVVTGTSSGIGRETALYLAAQGFHVAAGVRRRESFEAWQRESKERILPVMLDVTDEAQVHEVAKDVDTFMTRHKLKLAGIVGNAGLGAHMPIEHHDMKEAKRLFEVNVFGNMALVQSFMPIIRRDQARIVFISSLAGRITQPKEGVYSASKHAVEALADALRQELFPYKVSVSLVEPGFVATPLMSKILETEERGNASVASKTYERLYTDKYFSIFETGIKHAGKPEAVARKVHSALTDTRPKTRYTTTNFIMVPTWLAVRAKEVLPDRMFDKVLA